MPSPPLLNTFEGGTDGTTITQANSGGASGDAWSVAPIIGTGVSLTFSSLQAAHGALAMRIAQPATPASTRVEWDALGALTGNVFFRTYLHLPTLGQIVFGGVRTNAASALSAEIFLDATGHVTVHQASGATIATLTGATAVTAGTWVRIEWRILSSATVGEFEWRLYASADSTSITETKSATGLALGANTSEVRWGQVTNTTANLVSYHDDLAVSTVDWLGPSTSLYQPTGVHPLLMTLGR